MLWSIHSCNNKVSADQYHRHHIGLGVRHIEVTLFLKLCADRLVSFGLRVQVQFLPLCRGVQFDYFLFIVRIIIIIIK